LTKQGLEFISARCGKSWATKDAEGTAHISAEMALCIATCHSLTRSQQTGDFIGNPVDQTMFAAIGADILQPSDNNNVVLVNESSGNQAEIVRHFDFDHHRMTQSVIVKSRGKLYAFVKGSGESMIQICSNDLPTDFNATLRESARAGVYQITMAYKELEAGLTPNQIQEMSRGDIERDLGFLGVINFKNVLREETPGVIEQLEKGDVRCVIVTGDSVLTGIRIAKESGIISAGSQVLCSTQLDSDGRYPVWLDEDDNPAAMPLNLTASNVELAISGSVWENLCNSDPQAADEWAEHIRVYGRCTPVNKVDVVARFVDRGFITLMCGDGGNDCGALKTAHVGIALSDAEASIVAPFTSLDKTITSVLDVLKEGRCTLASALASYKFMILYGQLVVSLRFTFCFGTFATTPYRLCFFLFISLRLIFPTAFSKSCFLSGAGSSWMESGLLVWALRYPSLNQPKNWPPVGRHPRFWDCRPCAVHWEYYLSTTYTILSLSWSSSPEIGSTVASGKEMTLVMCFGSETITKLRPCSW